MPAAPPSAPPAQEAQNPPRKTGRTRKLLLLATVILLGCGAAAAWFVTGPANGAPAERTPQKQLFAPLEPFTVNLHDARGERFAQVGVVLQYEDPAFEIVLKERLPAVRNDILLLLSAKQADVLLTIEGKKVLAQEIRDRTGRAVGAAGAGNPVREVLFSQFIVQ